MQIGSVIHGFQILKETKVPEVDGVFYEMVHQKTKAKLGWLRTGDSNKTFSVTFKTIPKDSTGVFHILEHSVLQGSRNYPGKAPFVEMMKTSLNTFMNAMTFADKTVFPISSRNQKDFENLVNIYMDAVFFPKLHEEENIFLQEGWHYESQKEGQLPFFNGVVLNEMRGANSSVESLMDDYLAEAMFPDTCYGVVSGGNPDEIVNLTYEEFKRTHETFYHPSNAIIYLDGDIEIEGMLALLDEEYLSHFQARKIDFYIPFQKPTRGNRIERAYAVLKKTKKDGYLGMGYGIGMFSDVKKIMTARILADYLTDTNEAALTKAILSQDLAQDVGAQVVDGVYQPYVTFVLKNINEKESKNVEAFVTDTIKKVAEKGLDKEQLLAILDRLEFSAKERDYGGDPAGLTNNLFVLESWLYGGNPVARLEADKYFEEIREDIKSGKIDYYYRELFLDNTHYATVSLTSSDKLVKQQEKAEQNVLKTRFMELPKEAQKIIWKKQNRLKTWQEEPMTEEEYQKLPKLDISDVSEDPICVPGEVLSDGTHWHSVQSKGIRYLRLYIPIEEIKDAQIPYVSFMAGLFGSLPLKTMDRLTLKKHMQSTFGRFDTYLSVYDQDESDQKAKIYYVIECGYLKEKEKKALELLPKLLSETDFDQTELLMEILYQQQEYCHQAMIMNGQMLAMTRAKASNSEKGRIIELADGFSYCRWIDNTVKQMKKNPQQVIAELAFASKFVYRGLEEAIISVTADTEKEEVTQKVKSLLMCCKEKTNEKTSCPDAKKQTYPKKEKIEIPAPVSYAVSAINAKRFGVELDGRWAVAAKILSMDYLWNQVRVLGGAYGTGMSASIDGNLSFYSYSDPQPEHSLEVFKAAGQALREFANEEEDLTGLILGCIGDTEMLLTPYMEGKLADEWNLSGITFEIRKKRRAQMLATTNQDLLEIADQLERLAPELISVIVGP
ncbi:MAG: insulinase family protein [Agathobacter sp.]|uniref:insulinase family protein n=1 Tax=Agathobacter sp. TaxID=2021311 RepID=UPI00257C1885|nr:insulinase family protein [Agathobacter sp.]MBQ1681641.1 insulinase family protein [Agathobacter sp.]